MGGNGLCGVPEQSVGVSKDLKFCVIARVLSVLILCGYRSKLVAQPKGAAEAFYRSVPLVPWQRVLG